MNVEKRRMYFLICIRYHLGMAYYKNGTRDLAKKELNAALEINSGFAGADEAKTALNTLK